MTHHGGEPLTLLLVLIFAALFFYWQCNPTKTRKYRRALADLFVAGRIKQLAKDKDIELDKEFEDFKAYLSNNEMYNQSLDNAIESDLQEELEEATRTFEIKKDPDKQ